MKALPGAVSLVTRSRRFYRASRTSYLQWRYPGGGFLECNGVRVFCNFYDASYAWYDGDSAFLAFDQEVLAAILTQSKGNVALDIGAHFGFFAAYLAGLTPPDPVSSWRVFAIEPDESHFRCLQQTIRRSPASEKVTPMRVALAEYDKPLMLFRSSASCLHSYAEPGSTAVETVDARSLDSLVAACLGPSDRVALIKIDVDGAEPLLFAGGRSTLAAHKPTVLMEFAPIHLRAAGTDPREFFMTLCAQYHVYWLLCHERSARRVTEADFGEIQDMTGEGITDLVLASRPLALSRLDLG